MTRDSQGTAPRRLVSGILADRKLALECMARWCELTGSPLPSGITGPRTYQLSSSASRNWDSYPESVSASSATVASGSASRRYDGAYQSAMNMNGFDYSTGLSDMELMQMYVMEDTDVVRR